MELPTESTSAKRRAERFATLEDSLTLRYRIDGAASRSVSLSKSG